MLSWVFCGDLQCHHCRPTWTLQVGRLFLLPMHQSRFSSAYHVHAQENIPLAIITHVQSMCAMDHTCRACTANWWDEPRYVPSMMFIFPLAWACNISEVNLDGMNDYRNPRCACTPKVNEKHYSIFHVCCHNQVKICACACPFCAHCGTSIPGIWKPSCHLLTQLI